MSLLDSMHVDVTRYFIGEHPISVVISRSARVSDGAGGTTAGAPTTLPAQTMRKVGIAGQPRSFVSGNGATVFAEANVIAMPTADIAAGDSFDVDGETFVVLGVNNDPPWRIEAAVMRRG